VLTISKSLFLLLTTCCFVCNRDIVAQLFLRNCGLCVLSRFGMTDDIPDPSPKLADSNAEFVEAMHMAGATTVMYPLWSGNAQGALGTLGTLLFFVRYAADM
jgi:hypothetical protein